MARRHLFPLAAAVAAMLALLLGASASSYGPAPAATWVVSGGGLGGGSVEAIAVSGSTAYVGGRFGYIGPETGSFVGLDTGTGALAPSWPVVGGNVYAVAPDGSGGWFIGGAFASIGTRHADNLAHIKPDGTFDTGWAGGANGPVYTLAVSGTTVFAGGAFDSVGGGTARKALAAFSATTGAVTSFDATLGAASAFVSALKLNGSTLYVGGLFTSVDGVARSNLAAVDLAGDATAFDPDVDDFVNALAVAPGGTVYVGGFFKHVNDDDDRHFAASFNGTTGAVTAWNPDPNEAVYAVELSGSTVYLGGTFSEVSDEQRASIAAVDATTGAPTAWSPTVVGAVFQLAASGGLVYAAGSFRAVGNTTDRDNVAAFNTAGAGSPAAFHPVVGGDVYALAVSGSTVAIGGAFRTTSGGAAVPKRRDNLGAIDLTTGEATDWAPSANDSVVALAISGTTVYAGGFFNQVAGGTIRNGLAAFNSSGAVTTFNPNVNGPVLALEALGANIYAGGDFTTVNGTVVRNRLAAFAAGGTGTALAWSPDANGPVYALDAFGSLVFIGGDFTTVSGFARAHLASVGTSGGLTTWNPGANDTVYALAHSGSTEYAGGAFTAVNGNVARSGVAAFSAGGAGTATSWNPNVRFRTGEPGAVYALAPTASTMVIAGIFHTVGPCPTPCHFSPALATVSLASGAPLTTWQPVPNDIVAALGLSPQGVVAGGAFTALGYPPPLSPYNPEEPGATYRGGLALVPGLPDAPTVTAEPGDSSASVTVELPASTGGGAFVEVSVTSSPGNVTVSSPTSPVTIPGLANGTAYTFAATVTTTAGTGPAGTSSAVTPRTVPGAPTGVTAAPDDMRATVSFVPPASNGGEAVSLYTVTSSPGNIVATGTASPITLMGLTNDVTYTFTVTAANSAGPGPASDPSSPVVPVEGGRKHPTPPGPVARPAVPDAPPIATPRKPLPDV